jgi:hypothetical protein
MHFSIALLPVFLSGLSLVENLSVLGRPIHPSSLIPRQRNRNGGNRNTKNGKTNGNTAQTSVATDGSTIIDDTVTINGLNMRFRVSAPDTALVSSAGAGNGTLGINLLLHGDGGQSFFDFPNQGVNNGLMGVAMLAPNKQAIWGGGNGLDRPDGPAHSAAINSFLTQTLPTLVNFDNTQVFMEGVSGGSLLLSGFLLPQFGSSLAVKGAVVGCGGLEPQVAVQGDLSTTRIHFQSTTNEQAILQGSIPDAITAYEQLFVDAGLTDDEIDSLLTADASIKGGHCEFDGKDFVNGVQLLTDNFASIIDGTSNIAQTGVVGNENLF